MIAYADIVVANYDTNNIGLFLGYGNGTFHEQKIISLGPSHPLFVTTGDLATTDNRMDIAIVNNGTNTISILLGIWKWIISTTNKLFYWL